MILCPYLNFNGTCREAMTFYAELLGGKIIQLHTFAEMPGPDADDPATKDLIMHIELDFGTQRLMGSDAPGGRYHAPQGSYVTLNVTSAVEAERVYAALAERATIQMPLAQMPFALRFGMLIDRFGTPWMISAD